jgi:hypothetical protein
MNNRRKFAALTISILAVASIAVASFYRPSNDNHASKLAAFEKLEPDVTLIQEGKNTVYNIPFRWIDGRIIVNGVSGGKPIQCMINTACSIAELPNTLPLTMKHTGIVFRSIPLSGTRLRPIECVILGNITIGGLEIANCPALLYRGERSDLSNEPFLTIGSAFFSHLVLRIDYANHDLEVWPDSGSAVNRQHMTSKNPRRTGIIYNRFDQRSYTTTFAWDKKDYSFGLGAPVIGGRIDNRPVKLVLSSNAPYLALGITNKSLLSAFNQSCCNTSRGNTTDQSKLHNTAWSFGPFYYTGHVKLMTESPSTYADGMLGGEVLQCYLMTIDYPDREINFQWNYPATSGRLSASQ